MADAALIAIAEDDLDRAMPYFIRAANEGSRTSHHFLAKNLERAVSRRKPRIAGSRVDTGKLAILAYNAGIKTRDISHDYALHLVQERKKGEKYSEESETIIKLLRESLALKNCNAHDTMAQFLANDYLLHKGPLKNHDRGYVPQSLPLKP
ncbi:MAG: hypothetical protein ABGY95_06460 [Rubritalea sp.]|uniref:hypothetical protein n=1 Tax=Rubritalea sp. TaxID=2109375 RepID=UPI0032422743